MWHYLWNAKVGWEFAICVRPLWAAGWMPKAGTKPDAEVMTRVKSPLGERAAAVHVRVYLSQDTGRYSTGCKGDENHRGTPAKKPLYEL